jgi:hypothetical protein
MLFVQCATHTDEQSVTRHSPSEGSTFLVQCATHRWAKCDTSLAKRRKHVSRVTCHTGLCNVTRNTFLPNERNTLPAKWAKHVSGKMSEARSDTLPSNERNTFLCSYDGSVSETCFAHFAVNMLWSTFLEWRGTQDCAMWHETRFRHVSDKTSETRFHTFNELDSNEFDNNEPN